MATIHGFSGQNPLAPIVMSYIEPNQDPALKMKNLKKWVLLL